MTTPRRAAGTSAVAMAGRGNPDARPGAAGHGQPDQELAEGLGGPQNGEAGGADAEPATHDR